jgi:UPF0716 protein FxsA
VGCLPLVTILALPVVEILVLLRLVDEIGWADALLAVVASLAIGVWIARTERRHFAARLAEAREPRELARRGFDVACLAVAETLFFFPGLVSDVVAVLLLLPPARALLARIFADRLRAPGGSSATLRVWWTSRGPWPHPGPGTPGDPGRPIRPDGTVIDVAAEDVTDRPQIEAPPADRDDEGRP